MIKQWLPLLLLIFIGCSKRDKEVLSPDKSISSVIFKASDNPGLGADIAGVVLPDTIKFEFSPNVALHGLVPTIDFSEKSCGKMIIQHASA